MDGIERRHSVRLSFLGAQVIYKRKNGQCGCVPLKDLTKSSASFSIEHYLQFGEVVELEIKIPDNEIITIKGIITRLSDPSLEDTRYAVVQFLAFGTDERYNSMECYQQLGELTEKYNLFEESTK